MSWPILVLFSQPRNIINSIHIRQIEFTEPKADDLVRPICSIIYPSWMVPQISSRQITRI